MIKRFYNYLFTHTFDSLTKGLRKMISRLEKLSKTHFDASMAHSVAAADHITNANTATAEGNRASETASKLRALIGA